MITFFYTIFCITLIYLAPLAFPVWIALGFKRGPDPRGQKKTALLQIKISIWLAIILAPIIIIALLAGHNGPDTTLQFWVDFFIFEWFPLFCLVLSVIKWFKFK